MGSLFRVQPTFCPVCRAELKSRRFELILLWSMDPYSFRCPSCATMFRWNRRRLALPYFLIFGFFFAPPVFLRAYHGSIAATDAPNVYLAISWSIGVCILLTVFTYGPKDAEKVSDE